MTRIAREWRNVPGGYMVRVEVPDAYTNGRSRFDEVFVPWRESKGERLAALAEALDREMEPGDDIDAIPAQDRIEVTWPDLHQTWWMLDTIVKYLEVAEPGSDKLAQLIKRRTLAWQALDAQLVIWLTYIPPD